MKTIHLIAAARPNFMKIAPLYHALKKTDWAEPVIAHTGQHYDLNMSEAFFRDLMLPEPQYHLGVGSGSHAEQTGKVMIAYEVWGPAVAEDFFHGFSGWLIFIFGLAVLLVEMWALNGFGALRSFGASGIATKNVEQGTENRNGDGSFSRTTENGKKEGDREELSGSRKLETGTGRTEIDDRTTENVTLRNEVENGSTVQRLHGLTLKSLMSPPQFLVATAMLAGTLALAQGVEFREKIPTAKSFAEFPTQVGEWSGKRDVMDKKFLDELKFNDYIIVDYVNGSKAVNFYTAYYETQRKGESIHTPETCLPGAGWEFKKAGTVTVPLPAADSRLTSQPVNVSPPTAGGQSTNQRINGSPLTITINRAVIEKGAYKQLSYFWFPMRGRVLTNIWQMKWYTFWDALTRQRTDGALVRLITPVYPNEDVAQAEARLMAFTQAIVPVLNEFLPK